MATTLDTAVEQIQKIQQDARANDHSGGNLARPRWPMIVLNSPKGWTGPKMVDGRQVEGTFRSHQVPLSDPATHPEHLKLLEAWLRSYRPEELFDSQGRLKPELAELAPKGERRMGANPHANGGILLRDLRMPDFRDYAVEVSSPGVSGIGDTHVLGRLLRDVAKLNSEQRNFRVFGPDETLSNGLEVLFEVTQRQWEATTLPNDEFLAPTGRVMEMLSEHQCEGWIEGYLLTGRHGLFNCYEAFIHIVDSMFNQHAKWLKVTSRLPWRRKIASLNYLLASHVWRQDHNGFTHQDPGFIDLVVNKKAEVVRVYLTYRRTNHDNIHVRGYKEEGTITTPFDMTVLNDLDRFHLVMDTIDRLPQTGDQGSYLKQRLKDKLFEHKQHIDKYGEDLPEIRHWKWGASPS
jgi:xylulose-5-phosphate/fructose-6-phosphate phosphoketolase